MIGWHYIDGGFVEQSRASVPIGDLGLIRGYGVFDYIRLYQGIPFRLKDHLERLALSSERIGLALPPSFKIVEEIIEQLIQKNHLIEGGIRIIITGGESSDGLLPSGESTLLVMATEGHSPNESDYQKGISAVTTQIRRFLPSIKTTHYTPAILAMREAQAAGVQEALYLNDERHLLEATRSNFFVFKRGVLITDNSDEIIQGVTRKVVLEIASEFFPTELRAIHYEELKECEEAFICSSGKEILPLVEIDGAPIGAGCPGEQTQFLAQKFKEYVADYLKKSRIMAMSS